MYHLLFPQLARKRWAYLPLGVLAAQEVTGPQNPLLDPAQCRRWIGRVHRRYHVNCSYGGWFEDRSTLWHGHYMGAGQAIHLGVDFTVPEGTRVYSPTAGVVAQVWTDPDVKGGWGGRVVLKLRPRLFMIFAHLDKITVQEDALVTEGSVIGRIGDSVHNGNWFPHLHVQMVRGPYANVDGYGGFSPKNQRKYPDPFQFWPLPRIV